MIVVGVNTARSWTWGEGRINAKQVDEVVARSGGRPARGHARSSSRTIHSICPKGFARRGCSDERRWR